MADKYVAYVGSYTHGKAKGITICDCDIEEGIFTPVKEVEVGNPSYMRLANHSDFLYSVSDLGISSFKIHPDGIWSLLISVLLTECVRATSA